MSYVARRKLNFHQLENALWTPLSAVFKGYATLRDAKLAESSCDEVVMWTQDRTDVLHGPGSGCTMFRGLDTAKYRPTTLQRVVLKPNLNYEQQDTASSDARTSFDHSDKHGGTYRETCRGEIVFRIQGLTHSAVQEHDHIRKQFRN